MMRVFSKPIHREACAIGRLLLACCLLATPVRADTIVVRQVLNGTDGVCDDRDSMACAYYFIGLLEGYAATPGKPLFCPPKEYTNRQLMRVALNHMARHPGPVDQPAATAAMEAWTAEFPCPAGDSASSGDP